VWAGSSSEGLFRFDGDKLVALKSAAGLDDGRISALLVDRDGHLWVGGGSGLHLLNRQLWFRLGRSEGLAPGAVASVAEVAPGILWATQPGVGLFRWEGKSFRQLEPAGVDAGNNVLGPMLVTREGWCWLACHRGVLLVRDPQAVADETLLLALPGVSVSALAEDREGSLWAGTQEGEVWRLARGQWSRELQVNPPVPITALSTDHGGLVWAGTKGDGLYLIDGPTQVRFGTEDGLPNEWIRALCRDEQGALWIGTGEGGLGQVADGELSDYSAALGKGAGARQRHTWACRS
jgi:ligand-binding sensor domain-containing protein